MATSRIRGTRHAGSLSCWARGTTIDRVLSAEDLSVRVPRSLVRQAAALLQAVCGAHGAASRDVRRLGEFGVPSLLPR